MCCSDLPLRDRYAETKHKNNCIRNLEIHEGICSFKWSKIMFNGEDVICKIEVVRLSCCVTKQIEITNLVFLY